MVSSSSSTKTKSMKNSRARLVDAASWYCTVALLALLLIGSVSDEAADVNRRPCDEIYVVGEGETLHTISAKCDDPFIVERNPHINDPDDVFPGLVIHIISSN
ncbi:hypothetical protein HRI_005024300 [Hibiscus trionum]|uniref:LysM domain-containing protein n=1 Tax=Hibiscus trionum TaxID=183268 RepID=A0A9W7JDQ8_HIBTR|nr:hypothetical protein HRI_005024300 [Hibiscus trionum]